MFGVCEAVYYGVMVTVQGSGGEPWDLVFIWMLKTQLNIVSNKSPSNQQHLSFGGGGVEAGWTPRRSEAPQAVPQQFCGVCAHTVLQGNQCQWVGCCHGELYLI